MTDTLKERFPHRRLYGKNFFEELSKIEEAVEEVLEQLNKLTIAIIRTRQCSPQCFKRTQKLLNCHAQLAA